MNKLTKQQAPFTQVPNELLTDCSISLKAKGIYALMYSKPDKWTFYETGLAKESRDGKDAVGAGLDELVKAGWLKRSGGRQEGTNRFCAYDYELVVSRSGFSVMENPSREIRDGKSATNNTEISNTEKDIIPVSLLPQDETKTKATKHANPAIRLSQFLEVTGGLPPAEWAEYPRREYGWNADQLNAVWRAFSRYWNSPDCRKPLKRDWKGTWENWCDREAANGRRGGQAGGGSGSNLAAAMHSFVARRAGAQGAGWPGAVPAGSEAGEDAGAGRVHLEDGDVPF